MAVFGGSTAGSHGERSELGDACVETSHTLQRTLRGKKQCRRVSIVLWPKNDGTLKRGFINDTAATIGNPVTP